LAKGVRGEFHLFEADGRVWEFERPSLSTGQKFSLKSERVIFQHELINHITEMINHAARGKKGERVMDKKIT
jgi:hypothetical protein